MALSGRRWAKISEFYNAPYVYTVRHTLVRFAVRSERVFSINLSQRKTFSLSTKPI